MKFNVHLYPGEDGWVVAEVPALSGCISQGRTREEALANVREAIELCLEVRAAHHLPPVTGDELVEVTV